MGIKKKILTNTLVEKIYHGLVNHFTDAYIISFPKSGRTWVRMLLAQAISLEYQKKLNLDLYKMTFGEELLNIKTDPRTGNYAKFGGNEPLGVNRTFKGKKILLLVRDPRDVIVSYFYEWTKRRELKYDGDISKFVKEDFTLPSIISFMNSWDQEIDKRPQDFLLVSYENLHKDTNSELRKMLNFFDLKVSDYNIQKAVENSSFNSMLEMEKGNKFKGDHRLQAVNSKDKESFKMRKGKVGGYAEVLTTEDQKFVDTKLNKELSQKFVGFNYIKEREEELVVEEKPLEEKPLEEKPLEKEEMEEATKAEKVKVEPEVKEEISTGDNEQPSMEVTPELIEKNLFEEINVDKPMVTEHPLEPNEETDKNQEISDTPLA